MRRWLIILRLRRRYLRKVAEAKARGDYWHLTMWLDSKGW